MPLTFGTNPIPNFATLPNNFCVGVKNCAGVAKLELKGGTVCMPRVQFHNENNARVSNMSASIYFNGGTLRARQNQTSNWIASDFTATAVSDGGAVFDSNGYSVSSAAPLTHDARAGAAAKDGGVTKKGEGTVKLTGALSFNGDIRVEAGTLDLSSATFSMGTRSRRTLIPFIPFPSKVTTVTKFFWSGNSCWFFRMPPSTSFMPARVSL